MSAISVGDERGERLRIAIVVPPFIRVPPGGYGGTELVVADLAQAFAASGHEVTLVASGDSFVEGCVTRSLFPRALWPPEARAERNHAAFAAALVASERFDIVHSHTPALLAFASSVATPIVHTIHHAADDPSRALYAREKEIEYVCISARQAKLMASQFDRPPSVIHHGLLADRYPAGSGCSGEALFLGRLDAVKGPHLAARAARQAGLPLRLAGAPHDGDYFQQVLAPELSCSGVRMAGELGGEAKIEALMSAAVLLFPSLWEEPFGLSVIEAMLCGTPVVALRRGSIPEIVEDGVTGFSVDSPDSLPSAIHQALGLSRTGVRARAMQRFSLDRMARQYFDVYAACLRKAPEGVGTRHVPPPRLRG